MRLSTWKQSLKISGVLLAGFLLFPGGSWADKGIDDPSLFEQGTALLKARAYHMALDRFFLAGELSHDDAVRAEALRWTGEANLRDKHYDIAYHDFLTSLRLDPLSNNASAAEFKSAIALVYGKNYSASLEHLNNLEKQNKDIVALSDIYFWKAECFYQMGQYGDALKIYETILRQNPKYPHTQLVNYLVDWCYFQEKEYDNAYEGFSSLASKAKDQNLAKLSAFQAAECQFWQGHYDDAQKAYSQFAQTYAGDNMEPAADYGYGWSLAKQDKHLQAAKIFQKIVTDFPKHPLAPWAAVRAGAEDYAGNNNDAARKDYESGLTLANGKSPVDFLEYGLGWLDYAEQNYDEAIVEFRKVEKFSPQSPLYWNALYLHAGCRYLQAKYDDAKKMYDQIVDPAPSDLVQDATYWEGWCDYAAGRYDRALKQFLFVSQNTQGEAQTRGFWGAAEASYELSQYAKAADFYQQALKNNPKDDLAADCYSGLGWSQFQQEKYTEAIEAFKNVIEKNPGSAQEAEAVLRIADSYYNLHDYEKAAGRYQEALGKNIGDKAMDAREQLGWCAYRQNQFSQALSIWDELIQNDDAQDRRSRLIYWSAWAHFRAKQFKQAQEMFARVEADYPLDTLAPEAHLREGDCFFNLKQFKDSKEVYQSFIDRYPGHALLPDAMYGLQWSDEKLGERNEASSAAQSFLKKFPDSAFAPSIQYRLADTFFQNKKYKDAIEAYTLLLQKYPDCTEAPKAMFWKATAQAKSDMKSEAITSFTDMIKKYPDDALALEAQFSLGSLYFDAGDFKNALTNYTHIFKTNPSHHLATHALFNSAVCEKESGDTEMALEYFEKLVNDYEKDPLAPDASLQAGILLEKLDKPEKALKAYEFTMKSKDQALAAEAAFYHADLHKTMKEYEPAIKEFNSIITTYPDQDQWVVTAYAKVAECYEAQKKYQDAADTYNRILKYTKVKAFRTATLKRLKALKPFLHPAKKKVHEPDPVPGEPETDK